MGRDQTQERTNRPGGRSGSLERSNRPLAAQALHALILFDRNYISNGILWTYVR